MNWVERLFKYKLTVYLITIAVCLLGLFSLFLIELAPFPTIKFNTIDINLSYPGANAETMQTQVTDKVENALQSIPNVSSITANTFSESTNIELTLNTNSAMDLLQIQIRILQAIAASDLPSDVPEPSIDVSSNSSVLLAYVFTSDEMTSFDIVNFIHAKITPQLITIPGVTLASSSQDPVIHIQLHPDKLAQYAINIPTILPRINESFESQPTGNLYLNKQAYLLGINNSINTLPDFNNLIIDNQIGNDGTSNPITLKDIASIHFAPRNLVLTNSYSVNGHSAQALWIYTTTTANPFEVYNKSQQVMDNLSSTLPADLKIMIVNNQAKTMHDAFTDVAFTILIASILVLCIAFVFLGRLRTTLIPIITIPVCLLGATAIITALGMSLNILTLLAFVIAVGLVVDDAIVVVENITHHIENGMARRDAIVHGTNHIAKTVMGITATLLAVYLPIVFCSGAFITLLKAFAIPLAAAVFISGIVALTLTPIMSCYLISSQPPSRYQRWFNQRLHAIIDYYNAMLSYTLHRPFASLSVIIVLIGVGIFYSLQVPHSFYPDDPYGSVNITIQATPQDTPESLTKQLTSLSSFYNTPKTNFYSIEIDQDTTTGKMTGTLAIHYKDAYLHQIKGFTNQINTYLKKNQLDTTTASMTKFRSWGSNDVEFIIYGQTSVNQVNKQADQLTKLMKQSPIFSYVNNSINQPQKQLSFDIDAEQSARFGLYKNDIAGLLSTFFGGYQLSNYFNIAGLSVPIVVQLDDASLSNPDALQTLQIASPDNSTAFPLTQFVNLNMAAKPTAISSMNGQPSVTILANLAKGHQLSDAIPYINTLMATKAPTLNIAYRDNALQYIEGNSQTFMIAGLGLFFIYLLLAILFNNIVDPFIILLTVPFSIVSGILSLYILGDTLNLYSTLALITLIGLITKHGVLIVQFANQELTKGLSPMSAALNATRDRFRPIIMTTLAMTLGALPLLLSQGVMYVARRDIGIVLIVGLLVGTLFSLFIVPLVYTLVKRAEGTYATHTTDSPSH